MAIPALIWIDDPRLFLEANWKEIKAMVSERCKNCRAFPGIEDREDEVIYYFVQKMLRGLYKYDGRTPLTSFMSLVIFWSIQGIFNYVKKEPEMVPLEEGLMVMDEEVPLDIEVDFRDFLRVSEEMYGGRKRIKGKSFQKDHWRKAIQVIRDEYTLSDIAKKFRVSVVAVGKFLEEFRGRYVTFTKELA